MIGKPKRDTSVAIGRPFPVKSSESVPGMHHAENDVFRRHFEAMFAPLPKPTASEVIENNLRDESVSVVSDDESEWSGLSQDEHQTVVVTVADYSNPRQREDEEIARPKRKGFLSSKAPRERDTDQMARKEEKDDQEDDRTEKLNIKHDLDLQRLLKESNLLSSTRASDTAGVMRQKSTDLRLQSLGAKNSLYMQEKMPMSHRKGIAAGKTQREDKRRREAKENGVVLEKFTNGAGLQRSQARRDRGVDAPGIGKFSGGTLRLSRRDVAGMQGPVKGGGKRRR